MALTHLLQVTSLVLDEADRMLDLGFEKDVREIIGYCAPGKKRQTAMFSATWPKSIRDLAAEFLNNPVKVGLFPREAFLEKTDGLGTLTLILLPLIVPFFPLLCVSGTSCHKRARSCTKAFRVVRLGSIYSNHCLLVAATRACVFARKTPAAWHLCFCFSSRCDRARVTL